MIGPPLATLFFAINPNTQLAQCALHPFLKFQTVLARFVRQTKTTPERAAVLRTAFCQVVFAPDALAWDTALAALEQIDEFSQPLLAERLESLKRKREGLCLHYQDPNLAVTSSAIDHKFQRLERKFSSMQQFRTDESGKATLNAWAIVHDFRRYGSAAKRQGKSPVELAGVELGGQAWLQYLMLKLSQMYWLKPKSIPQLTQI